MKMNFSLPSPKRVLILVVIWSACLHFSIHINQYSYGVLKFIDFWVRLLTGKI